jgi:hypothetical protein
MALLRRAALLIALAGAGLGAGFAGCFSPRQPPCAFSCATDGLCPSGYVCASDGFCHHEGDHGTCDLGSDGGQDAADAAPDGDAATTDAPVD